MICDAEIVETALACCFRHRLKRLGAVRRSGMAMKYAMQVLIDNEVR